MPLNVRSNAINISVISFFFLSIVGWISGLSPFICCKRAMIGAVLVYIVTIFIVRVINMILLDAIINKQVEKEKSINFQTGSIIETGDIISDSNN
jgi:hypothetical protein